MNAAGPIGAIDDISFLLDLRLREPRPHNDDELLRSLSLCSEASFTQAELT